MRKPASWGITVDALMDTETRELDMEKRRALRWVSSMVVASLATACVEKQEFTPLGELELTSAPETLELREGTHAKVAVRVVRGTGLDRAITVSAPLPPTGILVEQAIIPAGVDEGVITIAIGEGVELGRDARLDLLAETQGKQASATVTVLPLGKRASIDRSYGTNGLVTVGSNGTDCQTYPLAGEKVLVAVNSPGTVFLVRLDRDGKVDTTFASIGYVYPEQILPGMPRERLSAVKVAIQQDGKILITTSGDDPATTERPDALVLLRLNPDGTLDTSYDSDGIIRIDGVLRPYSLGLTRSEEAFLVYGGPSTTLLTKIAPNGASRTTSLLADTFIHLHSDMLVTSEGRFTIPMYIQNPGGATSAALVRFTPGLTPDPTFGRDGVMSTPTVLTSWLRTSDVNYIGVGSLSEVGRVSAHVAAYAQNWGALPGFEDGGITFRNWPAGGLSDAVETKGGTLVVGSFVNQGARAAHVLTNGTLDLTLGTDGLVPIEAPTPEGPMSLSPAGPHTAYYSYVLSGQPCQLYRIWR